MKRNVLLMAVSLFVLHSFGQTIDMATNAPRCGDSYVVRQMEYFAQGDEGKNVLWDFSELKSLDKKSRREYFLSRDSILTGVEEECARKYELTGDSLRCLGYDTRLKHMEYSEPMTMMTYPFGYGYNITNTYHGKGDYCKRLLLKNGGTLMVEADAEGSIVYNEGDTLKNVLRVHTTRLNSVSLHAQTDTLMEDTSRMKQEIEEHYAWYVRGYRYPMYETSSITFYDNMTPVSCIQKAYRYLPDELASNEVFKDSVNSEILAADTIAQNACEDIIHYTVVSDGNTLTVKYSLDADASINALVCNSRGMLYGRKSARNPEGEDYQLTFDIMSLPQGEYVLYINVNGKVYNEKFRK